MSWCQTDKKPLSHKRWAKSLKNLPWGLDFELRNVPLRDVYAVGSHCQYLGKDDHVVREFRSINSDQSPVSIKIKDKTVMRLCYI